MTTPTPIPYYNDFETPEGRSPGSRCPRVLDLYMSGPAGQGYIYTPTLYRSESNGTTLSLMISVQDGTNMITNSGLTGIQVAYKMGVDGTQFQVGDILNSINKTILTTDDTKGLTLSVGSAIAIGASFGSAVAPGAYTLYLVNQTAGNSGELIWRIQYVVNDGKTGWFQHGVHQDNWPVGYDVEKDLFLSPEIAFSYGARFDGSGRTGYTASNRLGPLASETFPGSARFGPYKITPIST